MITFYQRSFPHSTGGRDHNINSSQRRGNLNLHIAVNLQIDTSPQCLSEEIDIARALNPMNPQIDRNSANRCSYFVKDVVDLSTDLGIGCSAELAVAVDSNICHCCCCCCCYIGQTTMMEIFCRSIDLASIVSSESTGLEMAAASIENRGLIQTAVVMVQIDQISLSMDSDFIDR